MSIDAATRRWIKNAADERAAHNGCRFDEVRGQFVVDWIQNYCVLYEGEYAGSPMLLKDWQYDATMRAFGWVRFSKDWNRWVRRFTRVSIWVPKKNAKAMALDTPVPTPLGWTTIGAIRPGDSIFTEFGHICKVVQTHDVIVDEETYEVSFSNGDRVVCNGDHLWETTALQRSVCGAKGKPFGGNQWTGKVGAHFRQKDVRTTTEIANSLRRGDGACNHSIDLQRPLDLLDRELPIDPYVLGCWLGDGDSDTARITCSPDDFGTYCDEFARVGYMVVRNGKNSVGAFRFRFQREGSDFATRTVLRRMGLYLNKHIPAVYLRASIAQRLGLLQGLMDTDGTISKCGKCLSYTTKLLSLAEGVAELLSSLGVKHSTKVCHPIISGRERTYFKVQFHAFCDTLPVFRLPRKLKRMRETSALVMRSRSRTVQIINIRRVPPVPVRCISVDNPSGLFLCGRTMIPTHNSPTAASWGLYLFAGDGEQGQKVYSVAKDGKQALISHMHAVEMVKRSPELFAECKINASTWQLAHLPSSSIYRVVAGDNRQSQEGLNGSVIVDETHVVDRGLMSILRGAGISRSEPMQAEFSTAGNNPDGYGKSQWDYGQGVNAGEFEDQGFLFVEYSAPQELSDEELDKNLLQYARKANPTLGRIVKEEEFVASYNRAKRSLSDLLDFKMYRLNIWQRSANPWLKASDWAQCQASFTEDDLAGRECIAALDLSRTRDMSALVLLFPDPEDGEAFDLLPYFWLPEGVAREQGHLAPFQQWAAAGHLMLTPGDVVDYEFIKATLKEKAGKFNLRELAYDMTYAEELTQWAEAELGIPRVAFPQTVMTFAAPTKEFERLVIAGKIRHNGHPVLSWQAGHVQVRTDVNQNLRPVKPKRDDYRKIDGIVSAVMCLGRHLEGEQPQPCTVESW